MRKRIVTGLTWRAGVAIAATALAAGTGATAFHLVNDTEAGDGSTTIENHATTTTTVDATTTTAADDHGAGDDATTNDGVNADVNGDHPDHPDNFGATVSADAQDGGVDGQEISDMAHERNDARQAANDHANANADDKAGDDEHGASTDHRQDGEHDNSGNDD